MNKSKNQLQTTDLHEGESKGNFLLLNSIKKNRIYNILIAVFGGAAIGFFYWKFFGCNGSCAITSNPYKTMILFSVMGVLMINNRNKKRNEHGTNSN